MERGCRLGERMRKSRRVRGEREKGQRLRKCESTKASKLKKEIT